MNTEMEVQFRSSTHQAKTPETQDDVWQYGDLILDYLARLGVDYVFGIPGGGIEPLYNALARSERRGGPRAVVARHECGAAFMADGYARESGKLGVCCATTGPGTTNLITGVACAYADGIPILVISAQSSLSTFGKGAFQESSCTAVDTVSMFKHCTKFNTLVSHPEQIEYKLLTAINYAYGNSPGPVHLSIPVDVLRSPVKRRFNIKAINSLNRKEIKPDQGTIIHLNKCLSESKKTVLLIGHRSKNGIKEILSYAEEKNCSIITTPMGKGLISPYHPLYKGVLGWAGHQSAIECITKEHADLIVTIGATLDETVTCCLAKDLASVNQLIQIDDDYEYLCKYPVNHTQIYSSPNLIFHSLLRETNKFTENSVEYGNYFPNNISIDDKPSCTNKESNKIKPQFLIWQLSQLCPNNTCVVADTGNSFLWSIHYWQNKRNFHDDKNLFQVNMGFASMGWAIGAAIGMALACPKKPIVCITGDGSMLMSGQEITTALTENLNILFIILNDAALGTVKHGQIIAKAENHCFELPSVNFASMANAMGIVGYRIHHPTELLELNLDELLSQGPCVLDILIDENEIPPLDMRVKMLGNTSEQEV